MIFVIKICELQNVLSITIANKGESGLKVITIAKRSITKN